jgi:hypothetical protein
MEISRKDEASVETQKELEKKHGEGAKWFMRRFLRQYASDSPRKLYRSFKKLYTRHQLPKFFTSKLINA